MFMKEINLLKKVNVKYIVVHCSDTNDTDTAIDIHKLHLNFGWEGIGYHKVITKEGEIQNGRPEYWKGAHVYGYNDVSLGICLIGRDSFSDNQYKSLKKLLIDWKKKYLNAIILGHRDLGNTKKTCPNFNVRQWCRDENIL